MKVAIKTNSPEAFLLAMRPKTLGAMACPVLIGSAFAVREGKGVFGVFLSTLVCAVALQVLANLANDYFDGLRGGDGHDRLGPPRALQMGWISPSAMRWAMMLVLALALGLGSYLVWLGGTAILAVGVLAIIFAVWYSAGPVPLSFLGISEIVVFFFFGPLPALGAYFLQTKNLSALVLVASLSCGFLSMALILTNNLRDRAEDGKNGKRTLAVRLGEKFSRVAILVLIVLGALSPISLVAGFAFSKLVMLALAALALPLRYAPMIWHEPPSRRFNLMLASLGQSLYMFGILLSLGIIYG